MSVDLRGDRKLDHGESSDNMSRIVHFEMKSLSQIYLAVVCHKAELVH